MFPCLTDINLYTTSSEFIWISWLWKPGTVILCLCSTSQYAWDFFLYLKALIIVYSVEISPSENFLQGGKPLSLSVQSAGHTLHVFINGQLQGIY